MPESVDIIELEDRAGWNEAHGNDGLPSQSWHYAWGLSAAGLQPRLAVVRSGGARMLMPFIEREWEGKIDIATIPCLSGASIAPMSAAPLALWHQYAASQKWIAGYIQLSPYADASTLEAPSHNDMFLLDLRAGDVLVRASRTVQRKAKEAADRGFTLVDDRAALTRRLQELHPVTMRRLRASREAVLDVEMIERWAADASTVLLGAQKDGAVESVCLFLVSNRRAEAHALGYSEEGRDLTAWLLHQASIRLRAMGVTTLNLGGGARRGDGIYRFKERFNCTVSPLRSVRQIYDEREYLELCRRRGANAAANYFPAYRAPASVAA